MGSGVLASLSLILISAGLALFAAALRIASLARRQRQRMEKLLLLAHQDIEPLDLPAAAWPELEDAGWQTLAWNGIWFGQPVKDVLGTLPAAPLPDESGTATPTGRWLTRNTAALAHFTCGGNETRITLCFFATSLRGEPRLFAEQLARVFALMFDARLRGRSEALAAALAERARMTLYLQHDMRNLAQWVRWVATDFTGADTPQALQRAAERLRANAALADERATRLIDALAQKPARAPPASIDLGGLITGAAQLAGFAADIDGTASAWASKPLLARALDNLFTNLAAAWRDPAAVKPRFFLRRIDLPDGKQATAPWTAIEFFCPWPPEVTPLPAEKLFEPFASGRPGGLGLGLYQTRQSITEAGGELRAVPTADGMQFSILLPATDV